MSKKKIPHVDPRMHEHFMHALHEEVLALLSLLKFMWPLAVLALMGIGVLIYAANPFAPTHLKLAAGQPDSSLAALGKQYAEYFRQNGVQLELVTTAGAAENLELLKSGKVDAAFSLGGIGAKSDAPDIRSLGSVEYQPFWLFYRGEEFKGANPSDFFNSHVFSINIPGSGTRNMAEKILSLHGIDHLQDRKFVTLTSAESVDALLSGKIDGVFLTAGIESKTIQRILTYPDVRIFNFSVAEAYTKRLPFLEVLNLPLGSIDLRNAIPSKDVKMVATTTTILASTRLHPATQQLFLATARKIDSTGGAFFNRPGGFPAHIARDVPLSSVAERYYTKGHPALDGYVPYWVASFFDEMWFILFAIFAVGYPLIKLAPNYRSIYATMCITDRYHDLTEIDHQLMAPLDTHAFKTVLAKFDANEKEVNHLWVPANLQADFYNLKNSVEIVRSRTVRVQNKLAEPDDSYNGGVS